MYRGKRLIQKEPRSWNKSVTTLVSLLLVVCVTIGGTLAYLIANTSAVENTFTPSEVTTYVDETIDGNVKKEVKIQNTGDTTAYIRAAVVVTWQDGQGNVYGQKPEACEKANCDHTSCGKDYAISYNKEVQTASEGQWLNGADGFWYWTKPVAAKASTGVLISSCEQLNTVTVGETTYYLAVEILSSGIQSVPTSVVTEVWKSGVSDASTGTLAIIEP